jgi:hypothetical protein
VGWGEAAYRDAFAKRWPRLAFEARNPFAGEQLPGTGDYDTILLSGLLESCARGEVYEMLHTASGLLAPGGLLALHDTFLPSGVLPPPEVVLGALGRHITRGGCRHWSRERLEDSLRQLGYKSFESKYLPAGSVLVTAGRT